MNADTLTEILRDTIVGTVRRDGPDLSARQFAVMLICYIETQAHTVRGLAARLNISKPAVTRSLDRLEELGLARRIVDPADRRSVLVQRTREGTAYINAVRSFLVEASRRIGGNGNTQPPEPRPGRARPRRVAG
jgi:DNA-binding MarR family transcriptional regulator